MRLSLSQNHKYLPTLMSKILITGATGFLGTNIALGICKDHELIALKRRSSDLSRWPDTEKRPYWINLEGDWKREVLRLGPDIIIHCAWIGVEASERNNWDSQIKNIGFVNELLSVAGILSIKKFIVLGSQAEYGNFSGIVDENASLLPVTAYGAVKVASSYIVRTFCEQRNIDWYWLRLFSFFGEGEGDNWLIPSVIKKMLKGEEIDVTEGNQKYAYLYVKDLGFAIKKILECRGKAGTYNISADQAISLRSLLEKIKDHLNVPCKLNFGAIPYRENQPMLVQGDSRKFINNIGRFNFTSFEDALLDTVSYYERQFKSE